MTAGIDTSTWESSGTRVDTLIQRIAEKLGATVKASTVFGDPVERDGLTVIPVARARWGFGGGGGTSQPERGPDGGGGGGGAMSITPVGYIEIGHGQTTFRPIQDARRFLPYVFGATALLMLSVFLLDRRPKHLRTTWKRLRR
jgi:uncharacterized spore protein YtfJ